MEDGINDVLQWILNAGMGMTTLVYLMVQSIITSKYRREREKTDIENDMKNIVVLTELRQSIESNTKMVERLLSK